MNKLVNELISSGAVVLTRTWAAAFNYIEGISSEQKNLLRRVYNSYYNSPIDLRSEIAEYSNVTWIRAFKFIFLLYDAFRTKSVENVIKALALYFDIKRLIKNKD